MTHEELKQDLSLFALGALTAEESQELERHLAEGCDECEGEIQHWREVVELMPLVADVEAPPGLRDELMRRVADGASTAEAPARRAQVIPLRRRWMPIALAAAALLLIAYGITREADLRSRLTSQQEAVAQLRTALDRASTNLAQGEVELKRARDVLAERERDASSLRAALAAAEQSLSLLHQPGLNLVRLKQTPDAKPAEGHVLISPSGKALFYAFDLAPLPEGKVYELWWITEKEGPVNAGLFRLDEGGLGQVEAAVPTTAGAIKAAAVTIEPEGGVPKPTGPMVLLGNV